MNEIKSIKDPLVQEARLLQTSKGRKELGRCLVYGLEQLIWAKDHLQHIFCSSKTILPNELQSISNYNVSDGILRKISGTNYLVPIIGVVKIPEDVELSDDLLVVFDGVQDYGNIGTIIRTSSAFGCKQIASISPDFDPYHRKTIDSSRGIILSTPCKATSIADLKSRGYQVVVTTPHNATHQGLVRLLDKPIALVLGNETTGASKETLDQADIKIQIPMSSSMESLNVGVAAGITLYEMKLKLVLMMLTQKIKSTLGRNLTAAARLSRQLFDSNLQASTHLTAEQAIALMIAKCDSECSIDSLTRDTGLSQSAPISQLITLGYLSPDPIALTTTGEEILSKIWLIQEQSEESVLEGFSLEEKQLLHSFLSRIHTNCESLGRHS